MAKSKAQVLSLWDAMTEQYENTRAFLVQSQTDIATIETEIPLGGPESYIEELKDGLQNLKDAYNAFWVANQDFQSLIHMALGAYAGSPSPTGSAAVNISYFNKKLVDDSESIESRGMTKNAWAAGGSNVGDGEIVQLTTGADSIELQGGHAETVTLTVLGPGANGRSRLNLQGNERKYFLWDADMGTGNLRGGWRFDWGGVDTDFSDAISLLVSTEEAILTAWTGDDRRNMIVNGSFEAPEGSGASKIAGATILNGDANVAINSTTPLKGDQDLRWSGDADMEFPMRNVQIGRVQFMSLWLVRRGTKTGTFTLDFRSGTAASPTDHFTITQDISLLTADVPTLLKLAFVVPNTLGENPRLRLELATSGSTGSCDVDELVGGVCSLYDSSRAIAVIEGLTKFQRGDVFTASTTISAEKPYQTQMLELFGRSIKHAGTPVYWVKS